MKIKVHTTQLTRWVLGLCVTPSAPATFDTDKLHASEVADLRDTKGISITTGAGNKCLFDEDGQLVEVKPVKEDGDKKPDDKKPDPAKK